ncbi:MAG: PAAR domain-containing protein [Candidatus Thorarchaeota archaeon]
MPSQSRLTDVWSGICCCHSDPSCIPMTGTIVTASVNHFSGGLGVARLTDMTIGACGHPGTIVTASSRSFTNGLGKARVGDLITGCNIGNIITGNPTHETG